MAEETVAAAPVVEVAPAIEAAPAVAAVTPSPEAAAPAPEAAVVTSSEGAVSGEAPPISEAPKPLLSPETTDAKPVEVVAEAPKTDAEPAPLPVYEFKLPEGAQADNPIFKSFNVKLAEFQNLSKAEQAQVQKLGQEMIDMHQEAVKNIMENQNKSAWDWFKNRNSEWLGTSKKDPQIGGDNFDATVSAATQAVSLYGGTKAQQLETAKLFQDTGVENHPALLRFLANITKIAAKEGAPVKGQNAPSKPQFNPAQAMFGGTKAA